MIHALLLAAFSFLFGYSFHFSIMELMVYARHTDGQGWRLVMDALDTTVFHFGMALFFLHKVHKERQAGDETKT